MLGLIIVKKTVDESGQKHEKHIIMKSHKQAKHVTENLKKHFSDSSVYKPFNFQLHPDIRKKSYRTAAVSIKVLDVA